MRLNRLILDDFITYPHLDYEFESKPLLVQGLNLTDDNQKSNGAGKSGMATGIEFCITASNSRGVRDLELVTYGSESARAQLFASCDIRKEEIHIDWTINVKGSNKLTLLKRSEDGDWIETSFSNVNDGKKYILDWFAISKEDLFSYFIINKTRFKSFFESSNKEKVDLINRFSDASVITGLEDIDSSDLEREATEKKTEIDKNSGKIEGIQDMIDVEKSRDFKQELESQMEDITVEINEFSNDNFDIQADIDAEVLERSKIKKELRVEKTLIDSINKDLDAANDILDSFVAVDYSALTSELNEKVDDIDEASDKYFDDKKEWKKKQSKVEALINGIDAKLGGKLTCPSCHTDFIIDEDLAELTKTKSIATSMVPKIELEIKGYSEKISDCEIKISKLDEKLALIEEKENTEKSLKRNLLTSVDSILEKVRQSKSRSAKLTSKSEELESNIARGKDEIKRGVIKIKELGAKIEDLSIGGNKDLMITLKKDLKALESAQKTCELDYIAINDSIYLRNQWKNNFKQFRGFLANQSLDVIQFHCNRYLHDMGSDLTVAMEGYKTLANGTTKDEISIKTIRGGIERSYSSFSGGEKGRLLFASILANRHMINKTHPYGGLDFLSIDEIFEGVDGIGLKHLIVSASNLNIVAMVITHVSDEEASSSVLTIVKENGFSKIETEAEQVLRLQ